MIKAARSLLNYRCLGYARRIHLIIIKKKLYLLCSKICGRVRGEWKMGGTRRYSKLIRMQLFYLCLGLRITPRWIVLEKKRLAHGSRKSRRLQKAQGFPKRLLT